jgi:hypothetical protein
MAKDKRTFKPRKERVTLNERMLPDVKDLQIGEETTIEIKVKVVAISEGREWGDIDEEGGYEEREYGKEYAEAKRKEDSLKRATFVILSADEEDEDDNKSGAQKVADRIMADKRKKRVI